MVFINIGAFLAILLLGYFIGWKAGYDEVAKLMKQLLEQIMEGGNECED